MKKAYVANYLDDAMQNLGEAFDYAVNACQLDLEIFFSLFISTGIADLFADGSPKYVVGTSGSELVLKTLEKAGLSTENCPDRQTDFGFSKEYKCGLVLAYYQQKSGRSFRNIQEIFSVDDLMGLYPILQKYSEEKFLEVVERDIDKNSDATRLQTMRKKRGMSQSQLAQVSGVNIRTLQQYEVGAKDINKASVLSVLALASALSCSPKDIIEH